MSKYQNSLDNVLGFKPYLGLREIPGHPSDGLRVVELTNIEDCDILKEAVDKANKYDEKEKPKKVDISDSFYDYGKCPECMMPIEWSETHRARWSYCPECGTRLE